MSKIFRNYFSFAFSVLLLLSCQAKQENAKTNATIPDTTAIETDSVDPNYPPRPVLSADGNCEEYNLLSDLILDYEMTDNTARLPPGWLLPDLSLPDTAKGYLLLLAGDVAVKRGSKWCIISGSFYEAADPESVTFAQLNGTGKPEMIVIYSGYTNSRVSYDSWKELVIFDLENAVSLFHARIEEAEDFVQEHKEESFKCTRKITYRDKVITVPDFKCNKKWKQKDINSFIKEVNIDAISFNDVPSYLATGTYHFKEGSFEKQE